MEQYKQKDTLQKLYWEEGLSTIEIGDKFGVHEGTIVYWMEKHGIDRKSYSEARVEWGRSNPVPIKFTERGYIEWVHTYMSDVSYVSVHRLVAVAEYGFDAVANKEVHHENGVTWDNRPCNLKPLSTTEHNIEHSQLSKFDRRLLAALRQPGRENNLNLAKAAGISPSYIRAITERYDWKPEQPWKDEELLNELYFDEDMTVYEIADELGCTYPSVIYWMDKYGIERNKAPNSIWANK